MIRIYHIYVSFLTTFCNLEIANANIKKSFRIDFSSLKNSEFLTKREGVERLLVASVRK